MYLKAFFNIIFFLQFLSPAKRSIIEVLHGNQDVVTFTQFIKTDGLLLTFQQYGPVAFLSPISGTFESLFESPFGNNYVVDEYLINQAHLNLLTIGTQPENGRRLLQYHIINGTCSIHTYKNKHIRLGTYFYSKDASSFLQETSPFAIVPSVSTLENDSIIHVLEKPIHIDNVLTITATKSLNVRNTSFLYEYNLGPFLDSTTSSEKSLDIMIQSGLIKSAMSAIRFIMDVGYIQFYPRIRNLLNQQWKSKSTICRPFSKMFYDFQGQHISQNVTPSTCPNKVLNLNYGVCLNELDDISFYGHKSNEFSLVPSLLIIKVHW